MNPLAPEASSAPRRSATPLVVLTWLSLTILIIGGINWGLVGLFRFDLVAMLFGHMTVPTRAVYTLVGLAALGALPLVGLLPRLVRGD
jgi:uncharacterized membrane protein YuzA (DUF378 family)